MSQHDLDIANAAFAATRADINLALAALGSQQSGASAPATTLAYMPWADTANGVLKRRNAANSAWVLADTLAETFDTGRSSNTILGVADMGKNFRATASFTQTLTAAATLGDGWCCSYRVEYGATIVFDPNSTEQIDGGTTLSIVGPQQGFIFCTGSAFYTVGFATAPATWTPTDGSGAALSFTSVTAKFKLERGVLQFQGGLTYPVNASGANAQINGLPVAPGIGDTVGSMLDNSGLTIIPYFVGGAIQFYRAGTFTRVLNSELSGKQLFFAGSYAV